MFSDGATVMRWLVEPCSTAFYSCIADVERVHGHEGRTTVRVLDWAEPGKERGKRGVVSLKQLHHILLHPFPLEATMLTVTLYLCNGNVLALEMTRSQKDRVSRTLNQTSLPTTPFTVSVEGADLEIPWRAIRYLASRPLIEEAASSEAAD